MTIPLWVLLGFAGWTVLLLFSTVGYYRWSRILTGCRELKSFRAHEVTDDEWYNRAMRAHVNCIENLPIYAAIVLVLVATNLQSPLLDTLAVVILAARVVHSTLHITLEQTNLVAGLRFVFYVIQPLCMIWMGVYIAFHVS